MELKIQKVLLHRDKRILITSDIHGNLKLFQKILKKVNFSENDILIIGGDIIEKGDQSLETLRYLMKLHKSGNVWLVLGNCDSLTEEMETQDIKEKDQIISYMLWRKECLFNEFCQQLHIPVVENMDLNFARRMWKQNFGDELAFLANLPHIIDAHDFLVAHAGLTSERLEEQDPKQVMKYDNFIEDHLSFSKYLFVGHMPVLNYCDTIGSANPIMWEKQKIISMDGGNVIKDEGQLNMMVISNLNEMKISFVSVEDLPQYIVMEPQEATQNSIYISWFENDIEILEQKEEFSWCRHLKTKKELNIPNDFIFGEGEVKHCYDISDYWLPLKQGDIVSLIFRYTECSYVKKNGVLGWVSNDKLGREIK